MKPKTELLMDGCTSPSSLTRSSRWCQRQTFILKQFFKQTKAQLTATWCWNVVWDVSVLKWFLTQFKLFFACSCLFFVFTHPMSFFRSSPPSDYLLCPNLLHLCLIAGWSLSLLRILVFATTCKTGLNSTLPEVWVKFASFHLRPVLWNRILSYPGNSRFNPGFSVLQRWITSCWGRWPRMFQVGDQQV